MRVQNISFNLGTGASTVEEKSGNKRCHQSAYCNKNLCPGNALSRNQKGNLDPAASRRAAQKKAMGVVKNAWVGDQRISDDLADRRERVRKCVENLGEAAGEVKRIREGRLALKEEYCIADDSQEEKDLRLLEKKADDDAKRPGRSLLTDEEKKRLKEIMEAGGPTEYQQKSLEMREEGFAADEMINENTKTILSEGYRIRAIKGQMLKSQTMLKASDSAQEILKAASREIIKMLEDEVRDHLDKEAEIEKEEAERRAEEEKNEEEKILEQQEEKVEREDFGEQVPDSGKIMQEAETELAKAQQAIEKVLAEMKAREEAMKGILIDTAV